MAAVLVPAIERSLPSFMAPSALPRIGTKDCGSRLGERADTYGNRMMQRALTEAGIERAGTHLAVFERGRRQSPVVGKVISVGLVDEISDRQYVIVDGADGRVHYADLGRLHPDASPARDIIVSLSCDSLYGRPRSTPRLKILSTVALEGLPTYDGPTWLDTALSGEQPSVPAAAGFAGRL